MDTYVNCYAHSNLHEALLTSLYAFLIENQADNERARIFHRLRADTAHYLKTMTLPEDPQAEDVRERALQGVGHFFGDVGDILVKTDKLKADEVTIARRNFY